MSRAVSPAATVVYDARRQPLTLGAEVGRGGEAAVFKLAARPMALAKLYTLAPREGYDLKLAWMQAHPPDDPSSALNHASIAWPTELLYDASGALVGYAMPYAAEAALLLQVFNPRQRARTFKTFNRRYLHRTARNLAKAIHALHESQYIVGDLNESNIMVTPAALVTLIDTDSFQVVRKVGAKPILHPCPVGKQEYTPPELQGKTFSEVPRQEEHDRFGLAVLIFQLLMEGNHPFRAQWLAAGDPPPVEDRIRDGHWPYARRPGLPIAPPRSAPRLENLHPELVTLFRRCFVDGHSAPRLRPSAEEWDRALKVAEEALVTCKRAGHLYSRHLRACPECEAEDTVARSQAAVVAATTAAAAPRPGPVLAPSRPTQLPLPISDRLMKLFKQFNINPNAPAPAPALVTCRNCQQPNAGTEIYCQRCATRLGGTRACPHCNRSMPDNARFCPRCGLRA